MVKSKFYNLDTDVTLSSNSDYYVPSEKAIKAYADTKQAELVSGTNIKTINNESILGSGNLSISGGTAYSAGTGIDITQGTISITTPLTFGASNIAIGYNNLTPGADSISIGEEAGATGNYSIQVGGGQAEVSGNASISIGYSSDTSGDNSITLGAYTHASANYAYQIGEGSNSEANSLYIGFGVDQEYNDINYKLLDSTGIIPLARMPYSAGTNISINNSTGVISATDTTYSVFTGATSGTAGIAGLVPAPASGEVGKYLKSDGTWDTVSGGGAVNSVNGYTGTVVLTATDLNIIEYTANEVQTLWEAN